ncbi:MAG: NAD(P)/FAD-dependent oxidoreductase [Lachnospiraceae bacterium]|nr:NAD(P)/FAD-dependent oxidoreductase [Lachnospiraceae bacterium]
MKKIIVIGGGPAGLTAAYEILSKSNDYSVTLLEESDCFGGISKTVNYKGNRMDMGGHRFFSKDPDVNEWWEKMLPVQGSMPYDDVKLGRTSPVVKGGPNPENEDRVMLMRHRVSRILFDKKFYDYPISLKPETFKNMGFITTVKVGFSYLASMIHKLPETNLENFYINRFGRRLYSMFFEYYTENLWGRHPSEIDASWGEQRVKGLSIMAVIKDIFGKIFKGKNRKVETSLIEEFKYPKLGPGQLWDVTASEIEKLGGEIIKNAKVTKIHKDGNRVTGVSYENNGNTVTLNGDYVISSMPLKDLVGGMNDVDEAPKRIAEGLPYRDYMTLGVLVSKINLKNHTDIKTMNNIVPDCWVYVQDRTVKLGRFQIYNNWSPYMVSDIENTVWIGLEYFVNEGDEFWNMTEAEFSEVGIKEMISLGLIESKDAVIDTHMEKVKKAYPAYFDTYDEIDTLTDYLKKIENLFCVGRNGQHRYNNIDHSMVTSFEAVKNILSGNKDQTNVWSVNTEKEYHEEAKES